MDILPGDPVPTFRAPAAGNPSYVFDSAAGRYIVLAVLGGADEAAIRGVAAAVAAVRPLLDDVRACFFGVVPDTEAWRREAQDSIPGVRWMFDDGAVAKLFGTETEPRVYLIDPMLRVMGVAPPAQVDRLLALLGRLPPPEVHGGAPAFAPVLVVPRLFEPEFCRALMDHYDQRGGEPSGFMREIDGVTRLVMDERHKRRADVHLEDEALKAQVQARIRRRLAPQIEKAFQFKATRLERYLIACYEAESGGWFRPHRDNTTKGTAHRRFAVSINLNAEFEGGDLRFPEFGPRTYRPPVGGAVVFSCSLLHEATPVTRGRRFAFLPFLYDEAGAKVREANIGFLDPALSGGYTAGAAEPAEAPAAS